MRTNGIACLATATALLLSIPAATAVPGVFGSQVLAGESDWILPAKGNSRPFNAIYADLGQAGDPRDDCVILRTTTASSPATHADFTTSTAQTPKVKDIRLTTCHGGPAGSQLSDQSIVELRATWTSDPDLHAVYADINANAKYDKADYLYLTTKTASGTAANAVDGFVPTTGPSSWTVRLTPTADQTAGTFVMRGDSDFASYASAAQLVFAQTTTDTLDAGVIIEREDGQWLWAPSSSSTMLLKGIIPPLDSVRISAVNPAVPDVRVTGINVATPEIVAGSNFNVLADLTNVGKLAGIGLVVSKLDGSIVDARATPLLGAGEKTTLLLSIPANRPGTSNLAVNDLFAVIEITGAESDMGMAALEAKVAALEARLAALESQSVTSGTNLQVQGATAQAKSPAAEPISLVLALGALAFLVRRRSL